MYAQSLVCYLIHGEVFNKHLTHCLGIKQFPESVTG